MNFPRRAPFPGLRSRPAPDEDGRMNVPLWSALAVLLVGLLALVSPAAGGNSSRPPLAGPGPVTTEFPQPVDQASSDRPVGASGDWRLVFGDEFDRPLDEAKWNRCYPTTSNGCTNLGNAEEQWYQGANVDVRDGQLQLTARREKAIGDGGKPYEYTSGMVATGPPIWEPDVPAKFAFTYGFVEARVKAPAGRGLWSALWLLPESQQWPPEIDVFELLGHEPTRVHLNAHFRDDRGEPAKTQGDHVGADFSTAFHTFGVDWEPGRITWYVDGVPRRNFRSDEGVPDVPMYVLMNLAVGGNFPGPPDGSTPFPARYDIDWVRIWQRSR